MNTPRPNEPVSQACLRTETATRLYEKTLDIIEKEYDPENPNFNITRTNLIGLYEKCKEAGGAEFQTIQHIEKRLKMKYIY
ncbi:MAG: hypothetical protein ACYDEF_13095 [Methanosarcina sp.]|nr:hypothetical protein BGV40_13755 [Methanosarcina sp. Ant1]